MRPVGFSTGALARGDFRLALQTLATTDADAVELSALRLEELGHLAAAADTLDLSQFKHISVHAPSNFLPGDEAAVVDHLEFCRRHSWPVVIHPDVIADFASWRRFGSLLLVENMDKRKPIGRSAAELKLVVDLLPDARLCFDIAHARQFDSSMTEAYIILKTFSSRIGQIHISEVDTRSRHVRISPSAIRDYQEVAELVPTGAPLILESSVAPEDVPGEIRRALAALAPSQVPVPANR